MIVAFVGRSGVGKTWVLERLVPLLRARGLQVAVLKHTHHELWADREGSDTDRLRRAGAWPVGICGPGGHTWFGLEAEWPAADLVLLEGFKTRNDVPRIEVIRGGPALLEPAEMWAAVGEEVVEGVPCYPFDGLEGLADRLAGEVGPWLWLEVDGKPEACPLELERWLAQRWPAGKLRLIRGGPSAPGRCESGGSARG